MNYTKQIAEMLGVEIEEEFKITDNTDRFKFTKHELVYFDKVYNKWVHECPYINDVLTGILSGDYEIVKPPILDEKEREYLSAVIKPFRNTVKNIYKASDLNGDYEYITIVHEKDEQKEGYLVSFSLPYFEKGAMYKGMEERKDYSLEELGL